MFGTVIVYIEAFLYFFFRSTDSNLSILLYINFRFIIQVFIGGSRKQKATKKFLSKDKYWDEIFELRLASARDSLSTLLVEGTVLCSCVMTIFVRYSSIDNESIFHVCSRA